MNIPTFLLRIILSKNEVIPKFKAPKLKTLVKLYKSAQLYIYFIRKYIMSRKESSWRGVVDLPEANLLLKYIPEAVPTINSYDNMCAKDAQEYYFLFAHN